MLKFSKTALSLCLAAILGLVPGAAQANTQPEVFEHLYQDKNSSYILLFAFPSAAYLDWSSPSKLARTSVQSAISKRLLSQPSTIGHAQFAWHCRQPDGSLMASGATGQSGENNGQSLKALMAGWGMSILELVYTDGHLESVADVKARILSGAASQQFSWAGFKVPYENCMQVADYVKGYTDSKAYQNYGFPVDPLKNEGGGCTSFAHAAVAKATLPLDFTRQWLREYLIPENQLGRTAELPPVSSIVPNAKIPARQAEVPLGEFLWGDKQWTSQPSEPHIRFQYYDPELFYESFLHLENVYRKAQQLPLRQPIRTAEYDSFQQALKQKSESWMQQVLAQQAPVELGKIAGYSGVIVDLRPLTDQLASQ